MLMQAPAVRQAALRAGVRGGTVSQGFTLHPTDEDLSAGTPGLGYFRVLPAGRRERPRGGVGFVLSPIPKAGPGPPASRWSGVRDGKPTPPGIL